MEDRATWIDISPGAVQRTGNPLDVAIDGKGYLDGADGARPRYTRNGELSINATGQLVTSDGDQVIGASGPITFQPTDHDVIISSTGIISVRDGSGTISAQRGQLQIAGFDNRSSCKRTAVRCSWRRQESMPVPAPQGTRILQGADREIECQPNL